MKNNFKKFTTSPILRTKCGQNPKTLKIQNALIIYYQQIKAFLKVPLSVLFSNQFLHDLDLIWELREWIPNP